MEGQDDAEGRCVTYDNQSSKERLCIYLSYEAIMAFSSELQPEGC